MHTVENKKRKPVGAFVATESQLGRSQSDASITRPSLMKQLAARGIRITAQRRVLIGIIQDSPRHLDAASLLQIARQEDRKIDRATVYRTIALLKDLGLIDELDLMHLNGEGHFYERKLGRDHIHMACLRCGKITEFVSKTFESLKSQLQRDCRFQIVVARLEVGGYCAACRH